MALTDKLTAIANAIREKTGKTDLLTLDDMPNEIASIASGGDSTMEDGLITRTLTEYKNNRVVTVGSYALANFASLEKVTLPMAETLGTYAFANDTSLKTIDILGGGTLGSLASSCLLMRKPYCNYYA